MYFFFCRLKTINKSALEELNAEPSKKMDPDYAPDYHEKAHAQKPVASSFTSGGSIPRGPGSGLLWWQKANRRPPGRKKKSYYRLKPEVFDDPVPETYSRLDKRKNDDDDDDDYHRSQKSQRGGKGGRRGRPLKALTIRNIVGSPDYVPEFDEDLVAKNKKYYESTSALHRERQFIDSPPSQRYQKRKKKVRYEYNYSSSPTSDSDLDSEANRAANAILKETKTTNDEILSQYPDLEIMDDYTAQILKTLPVNDLVTLLNSVSKGSNSVLSVQSCVEENGETTIYVVEEERPKQGASASASASAQPSDVVEDSSESVALTNANGEPITNVALDEDPELLSVNYDANNVGITVTESGGLQVTEVAEIVTPRPPPLQPAPGYLTSKTRAANEDRYKYKSLAGNPEPITVVSSSSASLASPISTVTVAETTSREDFDQSIIQQAMETMNPSSGAEVKPLMPVIYYKCKDSNQIFSVPVTHEQAISIAAGKAEYRPDLGKVVPINNNEASADVKDDKSLMPPSRSTTPMSSHEVRGEIDIRPLSPACSEPSVRTYASIGASSAAGAAPSAADLRRQQQRRQQDETPYDLGIADDVNDDDDDDEIEIEIQTDEAGNIISTNAETLLKKVGSDDNDNTNDITKNSTTTTNPVTPTTTSHIQIIPRQPILYNAAHIQHNNQDSYTSRSSISHEYNTATDYQNVLTINTASAFQTVATTQQQQQQQQPLLSMTHSVSTHSIGCGDDLVDSASSSRTPEPKPPKESRTIAIQTSPAKDASNDDSNGDDDGTTVGIQTQTSPDLKKRRQRVVLHVSDSGPDSNDDDVIVVKPRSNPEVTEGSNSEIPASWIVDDTVYPLYVFQSEYNAAMWQTCGLSEEAGIHLLISDDSNDAATHPNPDTQHYALFSPADVTHGEAKVTSKSSEEEHSLTKPTAVEHNIVANDQSNENYIYDHTNSEVIPSGTMSAAEATHGEPSGTSGSVPEVHTVTSPTSGEYNTPTSDITEMSNENNSVLSNSPDYANDEVVINEPMEMCIADESQVADDERNTLQNASSMAMEELSVECSSTKENQSEIEKDANNQRKDAGKLGEVFESVTPSTTSSVTPLPSKLNDGADYVDVAVNDAEDDRSTSPDSVRLLPQSPLYRPRTSGIFSRKGNIKFGGTSLRIKLRAPTSKSKSKSYADDIANDADAEDDDYDEFDNDYDDDDDDDDDDIDPPEYPSFTRRKSREEKMSEQQQTDDGTETEPGDEHPNSEGWKSEFADDNDNGDAISQQSIPESSDISQSVKEKQVSQGSETPQIEEQGVTIGQASPLSETLENDEQSVTAAQLSQVSATPQTDEQGVTLEQVSQESATPEIDEQIVTIGQASQDSETPEMDEQGVTLEQASQESATPHTDEQGVTLEQVSQESATPEIDEQIVTIGQASQDSETPEMDEQGVTLEQASQESATPEMDEQSVTLAQASQESATPEIHEKSVTLDQATPEMDEQGVTLVQASQESAAPEADEESVTLAQASQESATPEMDEVSVTLEQASHENTTPETDERASQEAVLHLSQLASRDLDASPKDGSLDKSKPLQDENSPESNEGKDEKKDLKEEMKTRSLPASPKPKETSQVSWLSLMQITLIITGRK